MTSQLESTLAFQIAALGLPEPVQQYVMPETDRKFAFDFAWPGYRLLVEVQGGTWMPKGGHNTGHGINRDCEKMCLAVMNGYRVMFVTGPQVESGRAVEWIDEAMIGILEGIGDV